MQKFWLGLYLHLWARVGKAEKGREIFRDPNYSTLSKKIQDRTILKVKDLQAQTMETVTCLCPQ